MILRPALRSFARIPQTTLFTSLRAYTATSTTTTSTAAPLDSQPRFTPLNPPLELWHPPLIQRIGKCMFHGANEQEVKVAGTVLSLLAKQWRSYELGLLNYGIEPGIWMRERGVETNLHEEYLNESNFEPKRIKLLAGLIGDLPEELQHRLDNDGIRFKRDLKRCRLYENTSSITEPYTVHYSISRILSQSLGFHGSFIVLTTASRRCVFRYSERITPVRKDYLNPEDTDPEPAPFPEWLAKDLKKVVLEQEEEAKIWREERREVEAMVQDVEACLRRKELK